MSPTTPTATITTGSFSQRAPTTNTTAELTCDTFLMGAQLSSDRATDVIMYSVHTRRLVVDDTNHYTRIKQATHVPSRLFSWRGPWRGRHDHRLAVLLPVLCCRQGAEGLGNKHGEAPAILHNGCKRGPITSYCYQIIRHFIFVCDAETEDVHIYIYTYRSIYIYI